MVRAQPCDHPHGHALTKPASAVAMPISHAVIASASG